MAEFVKLDHTGCGRTEFMYGGVHGEIMRNRGDVHIRLSFGAVELNFVCEDADDFLNVCSELLMQDSRWHQQATEEKEPF